jgi:hypothetical protein
MERMMMMHVYHFMSIRKMNINRSAKVNIYLKESMEIMIIKWWADEIIQKLWVIEHNFFIYDDEEQVMVNKCPHTIFGGQVTN